MKRGKADIDQDEDPNSDPIPIKKLSNEDTFPELFGKYEIKCELGRGNA